MGFLPDIRRVLRHIPTRRQTLFFSATMPPPIAALSREMLQDAGDDQHRAAVGAGGRHHPGGLSGAAAPEAGAAGEAADERRDARRAGVHADQAPRRTGSPSISAQHGIKVERIHGNRSQSQRTEALAGFKSGKYRVLVATDIAARGIDVTALGHVVNFDVPLVPEDYIHRVGRTARAEATGSAFTLVAPEEEGSVRAIERAIDSRLPRVTLPDFDYQARAQAPPLDQRPPRPQGGHGRRRAAGAARRRRCRRAARAARRGAAPAAAPLLVRRAGAPRRRP